MKFQPERILKEVEKQTEKIPAFARLKGADFTVRARAESSFELHPSGTLEAIYDESQELFARFWTEDRVLSMRCEDLSPEAIEEFLRRALELIKNLSPIKVVPESFAQYWSEDKDFKLIDDSYQAVPVEEKVNRLKGLSERLTDFGIEFKDAKLKAEYTEERRKEAKWSLGSKRLLKFDKGVSKLSIEVTLKDINREVKGEESIWESSYYAMDWNKTLKLAAERAKQKMGAQSVVEGKYQLLIPNSLSHHFMKCMAESLRGDLMFEGRSWLSGFSKKQIAPKDFILADDPHQKKTFGQCYWDAEGVPTKRVEYIKHGVFEQAAHDQLSSKLSGGILSASGIRKWGEAKIQVGFHQLCLDPGTKDYVDLERALDRGLILTHLEGFDSFKVDSGELLLKGEALFVEKGQVRFPVRGLILKMRMSELLSKILMIGRDVKWYRRIAAPSLLLDALDVFSVSADA